MVLRVLSNFPKGEPFTQPAHVDAWIERDMDDFGCPTGRYSVYTDGMRWRDLHGGTLLEAWEACKGWGVKPTIRPRYPRR